MLASSEVYSGYAADDLEQARQFTDPAGNILAVHEQA